MPTINKIKNQIDRRLRQLVECGLADEIQGGFWRQVDGQRSEITFPNASHVSLAMKDIEYAEIYRLFVEERAYNVKMLDGALIQMMYEFSNRRILRHRLAFVPAPHLPAFQSDPEVYLKDELHGDVVATNVAPFPFRYDYDARDDLHQDVAHPKSHLTLGRYDHCRIPVSAAMTPYWFIDFVLRNFYDTPARRYSDEMPVDDDAFEESITRKERRVVHVVVP